MSATSSGIPAQGQGQDVTQPFEPGSQDEERERRRRIRRTTVLLALVALGIYVAFIVTSMMGVRT